MADARYCNPEFMAFELMREPGFRAYELAERLVRCRRDAFTDERLRDIAQYTLEFAFLYGCTNFVPSQRRFRTVEELLRLGLPSEDWWRRSALDILAAEAFTGTEFVPDHQAFLPTGEPRLEGRALECFLQFRVCSDDVRDMALRQLIALMERCREHPGYEALAAACVSLWLRDEPGLRPGCRCPIAGGCSHRSRIAHGLENRWEDIAFCLESLLYGTT